MCYRWYWCVACEPFDESMKSLLLFRFMRNLFLFRIQSFGRTFFCCCCRCRFFFFYSFYFNFSFSCAFLPLHVDCLWAIYRWFFFLLLFRFFVAYHHQVDCTAKTTLDTGTPTDHTLQKKKKKKFCICRKFKWCK